MCNKGHNLVMETILVMMVIIMAFDMIMRLL